MSLLFGYFPLRVRVSLGFRRTHKLKVAGSNPDIFGRVSSLQAKGTEPCFSSRNLVVDSKFTDELISQILHLQKSVK